MPKTIRVSPKVARETDGRGVSRRFLPRTDVVETEEAYVLRLDMPGVAETDVDLHLEDGVLTVRGKVVPPERGERRLTLREYEVGDYQRSFTVGSNLDTTRIEATLSGGVLEVQLPKIESAKPRRIPIKAG